MVIATNSQLRKIVRAGADQALEIHICWLNHISAAIS